MPICVKCGNNFPTTIKVNGKKRNLRNRTKCIKCVPYGLSIYKKKTPEEKRSINAEKFRRWYWKKRSEGIDPTNDRKNSQRALIIALIGGCQFCAYNKLQRNITFHHVENKKHELSVRMFGRSLENLLPELKKCVICCHNCHGEIHDGLISNDDVKKQHQKFLKALIPLKNKSWAKIKE